MGNEKAYMVISYFPLFDPSDKPGVTPGQYFNCDDKDDVEALFGSLPEVDEVKGCLWALDDEDDYKPYPVFVLDRAKEIYVTSSGGPRATSRAGLDWWFRNVTIDMP